MNKNGLLSVLIILFLEKLEQNLNIIDFNRKIEKTKPPEKQCF